MTDTMNGFVCALPSAAEPYQDPDVIREVLHSMRTVAVVGLSSNVLRPSHFVAFYLQRHGYRVIPVNPNETSVLGEKSYPSLLEVPEKIDVVDIFRAPQFVPEVAEQAVKIGAGALWTQYFIISPPAAEIAERGGLKVVMDRCLKVEHARHMGRMHWLGFNTSVITSRRASAA